ncbi:aldo/keto reductase [Tenacibaculum sp. A30]|uniref:aldo/keto reductase n=1 Tax=Tenacibaculum sp. A30 TaxID=3442644 RepID=UPI003EB6F307
MERKHIGIGTYRMSVDVDSHIESINYAIENGCCFIDTATNYKKGKAEELIGFVIDKHIQKEVKIITKAGYVDEAHVSSFKEDSFLINEKFYHSIDSSYIDYMLNNSLKKMRMDSIHSFLLHNPEYILSTLNDESLFYKMVKTAFLKLEELSDEGLIECYGISSNTFALHGEKNHIDVERLLEIANEISSNNRFKMIQFPFNIYENRALEKRYSNKKYNLFEFCKKNKIKTFINRPFIGTINRRPVPIVIYEDLALKDLNNNVFRDFVQKLSKIISEKEVSKIIETEAFLFLKENEKKFKSDKLLRIFIKNHLYVVFEKEKIVMSTKLFEIIEWLYNELLNHIKYRVSLFNKNIKEKICSQNPEFNKNESYASILCRLYLKQGADVVLTGMRKIEYVDKIKHLF